MLRQSEDRAVAAAALTAAGNAAVERLSPEAYAALLNPNPNPNPNPN